MEISDTTKKLVDELFVNGSGQQADRLVLTTAEGKDLGGWCKKAVLDRVEEALQHELLERRKADRWIPMNQELRPCPFCGGAGLLSSYPFDDPEMYMVECSNCECAVGKEYDNCAMPDFQYGTKEDAIAAWNRRAKKQG